MRPSKLVKCRRVSGRGADNMCLEYGLVFVSVRRIYFTLPKERRCCVSHCLGKKPGCKLSETLWRESRRARTGANAHTRTHTRARRGSQQRSGAVCCVVFCCIYSPSASHPRCCKHYFRTDVEFGLKFAGLKKEHRLLYLFNLVFSQFFVLIKQ